MRKSEQPYQRRVRRQVGVGVVLGAQDVCQLCVREHVYPRQSTANNPPQLCQQAVLQQLLCPGRHFCSG